MNGVVDHVEIRVHRQISTIVDSVNSGSCKRCVVANERRDSRQRLNRIDKAIRRKFRKETLQRRGESTVECILLVRALVVWILPIRISGTRGIDILNICKKLLQTFRLEKVVNDNVWIGILCRVSPVHRTDRICTDH